MPTENERKYVIKVGCEADVEDLAVAKYEISQGYLIATRGITVRVRKLIPLYGDSGKAGYFFNLKVSTNGRVIEIDNRLDKRDFSDLWNISLNKLQKFRYEVRHDKMVWELDFFKDYKNQTYMAIAEIEMPEGQTEPKSIPDIVKKNLLHRVDINDCRFSNKLLGDARYAAELLEEILKK